MVPVVLVARVEQSEEPLFAVETRLGFHDELEEVPHLEEPDLVVAIRHCTSRTFLHSRSFYLIPKLKLVATADIIKDLLGNLMISLALIVDHSVPNRVEKVPRLHTCADTQMHFVVLTHNRYQGLLFARLHELH